MAKNALSAVGAFKRGRSADEERMQLHVVLAQLEPNPEGSGRVDAAIPRLTALARRAAAKGADVIVFPEFYLTGTSHEAWENARTVLKGTLPHGSERPEWMDAVCRTAAEAGIAIVTGSAIEPGGFRHSGTHDREAGVREADALFNTAYFIDCHGELLNAYTKRNLWHPERDVLHGASHETHPEAYQPPTFIFETRRGLRLRGAMLMCWDLVFPEAFRRMFYHNVRSGSSSLDHPGQTLGPDVVFAPTGWFSSDSGPEALALNPRCEASLLDAMCTARAMENECYVCMCNAAGTPDEGLGRSSVNAPILGVCARLDAAQEALLYCTLDLEVLILARRIYRVRHDMQAGMLDRLHP